MKFGSLCISAAILLAFSSFNSMASALPERSFISLDSSAGHGGEFQWRMCKASDAVASGELISSASFDASAWMEAAVPGTVLGNLVSNGVYPDPYFGVNNKLSENQIPDLAKVGRDFYTYWFRTEFTVPGDFAGKSVWLEPQGINYRAEIWVNGSLADVMAGMFNNDVIDISGMVTAGGKNVLAVKVFPVDSPGTVMGKGTRQFGAAGEWRNGGDGRIGWNVTQLMTVGWDFTFEDGIRDRNTGIWRSIRLYSTGKARLQSAMVKSSLAHPSYDVASETVSVEVSNATPKPLTCRVSGHIEGTDISFSKEMKMLRGECLDVTFSPEDFPQLKIRNPRLWWPKNKGPQNLYGLSLKVETQDGGKWSVSDEISTRFGIREVVADRNTPDKSKSFIINGHRCFVRGTNWIPEAMLRTDDSRMEAEMAYTAQSGVNFLRLWGGGIAESDRFYELCDEYGFMVWQEFWMTGDTVHPHDRDLYFANVESTLKRIRNHPSIVFYVASNESSEVSGTRELIDRLDGTRPYQMQSEVDGIHDGSPYKQVNPMQHYENTASSRGSRVDGFNPEYGAPTIPIVEDLKNMMPAEDLWPIRKSTWDYLDGNGFHLMSTLYADLTNQYGESSSIEEFVRRGQLLGAMNSKSIWEVWNENKLGYGDRWCSGLLFWYHNCPNVQVCARMWDWWLEPTASLYHTMHSLEPLHIQFDYLKNTVSAVNDYVREYKGMTAIAKVYDFNSRVVATKTAKFDLPSDGVANDVIRIDFPADITPIHFIALTMQDAEGKTVSENFYWRSTDVYKGANTLTGPAAAGFRNMAGLKAAKPKLKVSPSGDSSWNVTLSNRSGRIAFFCQLLLCDMDGNPVHRSIYSDNFISLLPGQSRTLTVTAPSNAPDKLLLKFREGLEAGDLIINL